MSQATQTPTTPTRRSAIGFSLAAGLTAPALASEAEPEAELIRLCDLFTQNEGKQANLYVTVHDERERDLALEPLSVEWRGLLDQIERMDGPTTMAGAKAMARAAIATTPRNIDGDLEVDGDPESWFLISIAQFLAGSVVA
jgi:hypothetical protein